MAFVVMPREREANRQASDSSKAQCHPPSYPVSRELLGDWDWGSSATDTARNLVHSFSESTSVLIHTTTSVFMDLQHAFRCLKVTIKAPLDTPHFCTSETMQTKIDVFEMSQVSRLKAAEKEPLIAGSLRVSRPLAPRHCGAGFG